jgi:hypothetical protein
MFGRRKADEDPFAALKEGGTYHSSPLSLPEFGLGDDAPTGPSATPQSPAGSISATPVATTTSSSSTSLPPGSSPPTSPPPTSSGRRYKSSTVPFRSAYGFGRGVGWAWRLLIVAIVSVVIGSTVLGVSHSVHSVKIPSFNFNTGDVTTTSPGGSTTGGGGTSAPRPVAYLTPRGLRAGLTHVARLAHGAKLTLLRVDARTLSVYATRPNGQTSHIYLSPAVTFVSPAAKPGEVPVRASSIRPSVLGELIAQLHRRFGVPAGRIDYMVVSSPSGQPPQWVAFVKNRSHQGYVAPLGGGAWRPI